MEKLILEEIEKVRKLMDLKSKKINLFNKDLLDEGYKFRLNIPDLKSFDNLKNFAGTKNLPWPKNLNYDYFSKIDNLNFSSTSNVLRHLDELRPLWVAQLVKNGTDIGLAKEFLTNLSALIKKMEDTKGTTNYPDITKINPKTGKPIWEGIPKEGGLQDMLLLTYKRTNPEGYQKLTDSNPSVQKSIDDISFPESDKEAKEFGYDENKMLDEYRSKYGGQKTKFDMYMSISKKIFKPSEKTKISSTVKPPRTDLTPSGFGPGTFGHKIETTPKPDGSGNYIYRDVKDEWASSGGIINDDNKSFQEAWDSKTPWRPGDEIPEEYLSDFAKNFYSKFKKIESEPLKTANDIKSIIESEKNPDGSPKTTYRDAMEEFGGDIRNEEHIKLLESAWKNAEWRPTKPIPKEYQIKDTKTSVEKRLKEKNPKTDKQYDFEETYTGVFGGGDFPEDYKLFNDAWDNDPPWRPGDEIPEKFQTDAFKRRKNYKNLLQDKDNFSVLDRFKNFLRTWLWSRPIGTFEDIFEGTKNLDVEFEKMAKIAIDRYLLQKTVDFDTLRLEFLKLQRDPDLLRKIDKTGGQVLTNIKNNIKNDIDELNIEFKDKTYYKTRVDDFFNEMVNKKGVGGTLSEIMEGGEDMSSISNKKYWQRFSTVPGTRWFKEDSGVGYRIFEWVIKRVWNLIRQGSFWSNEEVLLIRQAAKFKQSKAIQSLIIRKAALKVFIPFLYGSLIKKGYYAYKQNQENKTGIDTGEWSAEWWQLGLETVWDFNAFGLKKWFNNDKDFEELVWDLVRNVTPGEIDRLAELGYKYIIKGTIDTTEAEYRVEYSVDGLSGKANLKYPLNGYGNKSDVQNFIDEYKEKYSNVKFCDISKDNVKKTDPLIIDLDRQYSCNSEGEPEDVTKGEKLEPTKETAKTVYEKEMNTTLDDTNNNKEWFDLSDQYNDNEFEKTYITSIDGNNKWLILSFDKNNDLYYNNSHTVDSWNTYTEEQRKDYVCKKSNYKLLKKSNNDETKKNNSTITIEHNTKTRPKNKTIMERIRKYVILENQRTKFGLDNFKHWNDTFTFQSEDEKNPGQFKDVKINMEDVMDRIDHYRKKYDEDDAFVRAVIDTHEDVIRIMFTKDLANIHETVKPVGLAYVLSVLRESRGEMEIWTVSRPANGNWFLVKGDFNKRQLANMELKKVEPKDKTVTKKEKPEEGLKKKEQEAIELLKTNESEGLHNLPSKVKEKVKEKLRKGWVVEKPYEFFDEFYTKSDINSAFNDKIEIYKLNPTKEFFESLKDNASKVFLRIGFCKSLNSVKNDTSIDEKSLNVVKHLINKCDTKFKENYGITQI